MKHASKAKETATGILGGQTGSPEGDWLSCRCGGHWWHLTEARWYRLTSRGNEVVDPIPACCVAEKKA